MAQSQQFLDDFQVKMDRLAKIRRDIQSSVQFKEEFTNQLKARLGDINNKIKQLSGLINELKTKATDLETRLNTNVTSITDKEAELKKLNDQITVLTNEKNELVTKLAQQEETARTEMARLQGIIDQSEAKLRELSQQKETLENESQALKTELQNKGDQQSAHGEAIKELTEKSQKQLQEQEANLMKKITDCEGKISVLEQQIRDKEMEMAEKQKLMDDATGQAQTSAQGLQQEINALKLENDNLIQRIIAATQAINEANDELQNIVNTAPNAKTKEEVDILLNEITQQIEQSIENIGRAAQGQQPIPRGQPAATAKIPNIDPATNIKIMDIGTQSESTIPFGSLIDLISRKISQIKNENESKKYKDALGQLRTITDVSQIPGILNSNGVRFKNNSIMGGRKTRKNRKQKGGFTYKPKSKRKRITSSKILRVSRRFSR
jgi:chromosome segregation ATPase